MDINFLNFLLDRYREDPKERFRDNKGPPFDDDGILTAIRNFLTTIQCFTVRIEVADSGWYSGRIRRIELRDSRLYFELENGLPLSRAKKFPNEGVNLKRVLYIDISENGSQQEGKKNEEKE